MGDATDEWAMSPDRERHVQIPEGGVVLEGILGVPTEATGIVLFAHGSGSSRLSPRNTSVARALRRTGIGTLLFDLLTPDEDADAETRFDIALLTRRLIAATRWLEDQPVARGRALGYFGASTGAAAALEAAAHLATRIGAVVSRGGRPDLAPDALPRVVAPTLLIVGGRDNEVLEVNRLAGACLRGTHQLSVIFGASHLFEEAGALEQVSALAVDWFARYLAPHVATRAN